MVVQSALHVLVDLTNNTPGEVDIVAVHGLNPKNRPNHARDTFTADGKLWLRDFLPGRLSRPVRVMLYEYNSSPVFGATTTSLAEHAAMLLHWLWLRREAAPHRPLVFVCHGLGGLVVKEALVRARLDEVRHGSVSRATCLVAFFATPHLGEKYIGLGIIMGRIVHPWGPRNDLLRSLKKGSYTITRNYEQFSAQYGECRHISFYETLHYGMLGMIVDGRSAVLGLPSFLENQVAVEADHNSICRFESSDNVSCELVMSTIKAELEMALGRELTAHGQIPTPNPGADIPCSCLVLQVKVPPSVAYPQALHSVARELKVNSTVEDSWLNTGRI